MTGLAEAIAASILISGANYSDYASQEAAKARGGVERGIGSPAMRGGAAAGELGVYLAIRKQSKPLAWVWVAAVVGVNAVIVRHNNGVMQPRASR